MVNLIRTLKLKKINGELDNLSDVNRRFIRCFDGLKRIPISIRVDDEIIRYDAYTVDKNSISNIKVFENGEFTCSSYIIRTLMINCNIDAREVELSIRDFVKKHFNLCYSIKFN